MGKSYQMASNSWLTSRYNLRYFLCLTTVYSIFITTFKMKTRPIENKELTMYHHELRGSNLTRAMLARGEERIWCAVGDEGDQQAMMDHSGNDFTAYIVSYSNGYFYCSAGTAWEFAVPIKICAVMQYEAAV